MSFRILVPTKRVPDTDQRIRVRDDGRAIDDEHLPYVINPFDAIAVEEALVIGETRDPVEVVVVGVGGAGHDEELRTALAMGADRGLLVETAETLDPWNVARVLEAVVGIEQPDLVLMGKQAVDDDSNQVGQFLAARLDWPQATFASSIELDDRRARVARETDLGIEHVVVNLPAVITTDLRLNEPRYASLPGILRARQKPIRRLPLGELNIEIEPRLEILHLEAVSSSRRCTMVETAAELVSRLRSESEVI